MSECNKAYNMDCVEYLKVLPDKAFDLAVVDPPYGNGGGEFKRTDKSRFGGTFDRYKGGRTNRRNMGGEVRQKIVSWDYAPQRGLF